MEDIPAHSSSNNANSSPGNISQSVPQDHRPQEERSQGQRPQEERTQGQRPQGQGQQLADLQRQQMLLQLQQSGQGRIAEDLGIGGGNLTAELHTQEQLLQQPIGSIPMNQDAMFAFNSNDQQQIQQPVVNQQTLFNQATVQQGGLNAFGPSTAQDTPTLPTSDFSAMPSTNGSDDLSLALQYAHLLNRNNSTNNDTSFSAQQPQGQGQPIMATPVENSNCGGGVAAVGDVVDPSAFSPRPLNPSAVRISTGQNFQQQLASLNQPLLLSQAFSNMGSLQGSSGSSVPSGRASSIPPSSSSGSNNNDVVASMGLSAMASQAQPHWPQLDPTMLNLPQGLQQQTQLQQQQPTEQAAPPKKQKRIYRHESFPEKLHRMLTELEAQGKDDIASFIGSGESFQIHQPSTFEEEVIPVYFRHSKLASFKRQLSMYGFQRVTGGTEHGSYAHPMFSKDRPDLCKQMDRVS